MPVTTRCAPVEVRIAPQQSSFNSTSLLEATSWGLWNSSNSVWDSSFGSNTTMNPASNGLLTTVMDAYHGHNHLVLRPEDIWFAILVQFCFYINFNSEKMRKYFVNHAGKKKLEIQMATFDIPSFTLGITDLLADNVKDPNLREWIMPSFSTTNEADRVTGAIIMMGSMQKYFNYLMSLSCGIPSVTLLGEQEDWEDILQRVQYLEKFGAEHPELRLWSSVLNPVISNFVRTFKAPDSPEVVRFWQTAIHKYGNDYFGEDITGWIQAFCFWDKDGEPLVASNILHRWPKWEKSVQKDSNFWLDFSRLGSLDSADIPIAYTSLPIHFKDRGTFPAKKVVLNAVAGSVGWKVVDSEAIFPRTRNFTADVSISNRLYSQEPLKDFELWSSQKNHQHHAKKVPQISDLSELSKAWEYEKGGKHDTLQPVTGWWVVEMKDGKYGYDPDVPDVQFDSDEEDYDDDLARNGRPLRDEL